MRTTIEIPDRQRARLLELAAQRGEKGFSRLVQEAVERMLAESDSREVRTKAALAVEGSIAERQLHLPKDGDYVAPLLGATVTGR